jgi:hypothetical protein
VIVLEPANPQHLERLRLELTPADDAEAQACGCANAFTAFGLLFEQSIEAWAMLLPSGLAYRVPAMLGVRARASGDGVQLWFHSTELFKRYPLACLRAARPLVEQLLERHQVLHGMINPDNPAMIRLSTWLGFELGAVERAGAFRFHPAVLRRK